jgi:hypothetical protein
MKRSVPKLAVRRETIRALGTLELMRAVGGGPPETDKEMCTLPAIVKPAPAG